MNMYSDLYETVNQPVETSISLKYSIYTQETNSNDRLSYYTISTAVLVVVKYISKHVAQKLLPLINSIAGGPRPLNSPRGVEDLGHNPRSTSKPRP